MTKLHGEAPVLYEKLRFIAVSNRFTFFTIATKLRRLAQFPISQQNPAEMFTVFGFVGFT